MSDTLRAAAQQALEALESLQGGCTDSGDGTFEAITVWCPEVIDALRAALAVSQWVPVAERLPEKFTEVLVAFAGQMSIASTGQYTNSPQDKNGWCYPAENNGICDDGSDPVVTHWMPLPDAPASAPKEQA